VSVKADIETACGLGKDALFSKEVDVGVKSKLLSERAKGFRGGGNALAFNDGQALGQLSEVLGGLSIGFTVKPTDKLDDVAT